MLLIAYLKEKQVETRMNEKNAKYIFIYICYLAFSRYICQIASSIVMYLYYTIYHAFS